MIKELLRELSKIKGYLALISISGKKCTKCNSFSKKIIFTTISPKNNTWNFKIICEGCLNEF